jgi:hypothetical protein
MTDQTGTLDAMTSLEEAQVYVDRLVAELRDRGLQVKTRMLGLAVKNPAVTGTDAHGSLMSPGMTQEVLLLDRAKLGLTWWWVWPGMRSGERGEPEPPSQIEALCPGGDVGFAADRITKVVRLRDNDLPHDKDAQYDDG